jgi:SAM-dependent methyltransferase
VYAGGADDYERLVSAEDADGRLLPALAALVPLAGARVLEIGVGTGALAVPLAERGLDLVGLDLSTAMPAQLRRKSTSVPVVAGDATRLPFANASFGGAYARWVLHLIPSWREAVDEFVRVVGPGGVVVVEPGGYRGDWLDVWQRIEEELGPAVRHIGLDVQGGGAGQLDAAFAQHGAKPREQVTIVEGQANDTLARFFDDARHRSFSWTWRVDQASLARGLDAVEAWARERYGDDLTAVESQMQMAWRLYDLPIVGGPSAAPGDVRYPRRRP